MNANEDCLEDADVVPPPPIVSKAKPEWKMIRSYMMGEVIGEGMQGKVREALHSENLRRVAIKIVHLRQLRKTEHGEQNMAREVSIHRRLKHPNVVELIEHFQIAEKEMWYVVLELVPGGSLQDILDGSPGRTLPESLTRRFVRQLLVGLHHCHCKGVVHRDVKPSNLMVNAATGELKICDFGVAEELPFFEPGDLCSKSRGSPAFLPPEVASGSQERFSGRKVDAWATGITLYLLATGKVPFEGTSLINLFENIDAGVYDVPDGLARRPMLLSLVQALLAHEPTERLGVDGALSHAWLREGVDDEEWGRAERALVESAAPRGGGLRPTSVMRAIARMYGEAFVEPPPVAKPAPCSRDRLQMPFDAFLRRDTAPPGRAKEQCVLS